MPVLDEQTTFQCEWQVSLMGNPVTRPPTLGSRVASSPFPLPNPSSWPVAPPPTSE